MKWRDRIEAGEQLGRVLLKFRRDEMVVYGLPRGGVIVAAEVARLLDAPLDVLIARKIGHPSQPEYAIGAVSETGEPIFDEAEALGIDEKWLAKAIDSERREAKRRHQLYSEAGKQISPKGKTAVVVDDGIATGLTLRAAISELKAYHPAKIILAVPVAPDDTASDLELDVDELICLVRDKHFLGAVGNYYEYFEQVDDNEVMDALAEFND